MAEVFDTQGLKIIPFYLPQFHRIPENDEWWGEGFTEWTNVKKAFPLFEGHDQPRIPLGKNYYNLMDDKVKIEQARLAKKYGIFGFCYYHYWFKNGKKLLEKPAEQMLVNKDIDLPFCFCWANENWSRNWDGGNREILMQQDYGAKKEWEKHLQYLLPFFRDERYITVNGKPLFIIYKPEQIIDIYQMAMYYRKRMKEEGFPGICLAFQFPVYYSDMYYRDDIFDYRIAFEPTYSRNQEMLSEKGQSKKVELLRNIAGEEAVSLYRKWQQKKAKRNTVIGSRGLSVYSYSEAWEKILSCPWTDELIPGAFVDWDNTPRNKKGVCYQGFTTDLFEQYMTRLVQRARKENKPLIFINAWNEWGEGAYLEPDESSKYGKLEAIKHALSK